MASQAVIKRDVDPHRQLLMGGSEVKGLKKSLNCISVCKSIAKKGSIRIITLSV